MIIKDRNMRTILLKKYLVCIILLILGVTVIHAKNPGKDADIRMEWGVDKITLYQHEPVTITLYLLSPEIDIVGAKEIEPGHLDKGDFSYISHADFDRRPEHRNINGQRWYVYPVDSFVVTLDRPGKHKLSGGKYIVDSSTPVIIDDPYWGKMKKYNNERHSISVAPLQFEVKPLPKKEDSELFSGAIGNFDVTVIVPPGNIFLNEEAIALITVRGEGWINDNILPEYNSAFGNGTRLRSIAESRSKYLENGKLVSEVTLECTFLPTSIDNALLGPVKIGFFNPSVGSYQTAESAPVKIKVNSITVKSPSIDI